MMKLKISKQRDIIDRKAVTAALEGLVTGSGYTPSCQKDVLQIFKDVLARGSAEVRRRLEDGEARGNQTVRAQAFLMDQMVRILYDFTTTHVFPFHAPTTGEQFCVAAVGGYGRSELAPQSDIDLLFLLPHKKTPKVEQAIEYMLYLLWDLGLKVGHATRNIPECIKLAKSDLTIQTSLLDGRYLWGNQDLFTDFQNRFEIDIIAGKGLAFVTAKLEERDNRHRRLGDSRYVLEPNLKDGKGGLRDLQTLFWISKFLFKIERFRDLVSLDILTAKDANTFRKAVNFLWTVRCHLHYLTARPEERLTFDVQSTLASRLGYVDRAGVSGIERFMKHYFVVAKDVGDLTRNLSAVLEEKQKKETRRFRLPKLFNREVDGFKVDSGRLLAEHENLFAEDPVQIMRLFQLADKHDLDVHPVTLNQVRTNLSKINKAYREDPETNRIFLEVLTSPADPGRVLRLISESGVFGKFIPDFGRVTAQMQYDMYHVYTVDEHTIHAITELHRVHHGLYEDELPVATECMGEIMSVRALYVAVMLHDIAKGRKGDHSVLGAEIAQTLCPRLGLSEEETETVAWLVLHHLGMSNTAFRRDLEDPQTIENFVELVQSPERLRLLLVLTVVDIRAVGPNVWNGWKGNLLRTLYYKAQEAISGGVSAGKVVARVDHAKDLVREALSDWPEDEREGFIALGYPSYWSSFGADDHVRHAHMIRTGETDGEPITIATRVDEFNKRTEITIYTTDHPGLFSILAGAVTLSGASIVGAKIATFTNGKALDVISVQDSSDEPFTGEERIGKLRERISKALSGEIYPRDELERATSGQLKSRTAVFRVPPRVFVDNKASRTHTVIEVNGRDRLAFLYDVTQALNDLGLQISSAHVATFGERAVDVFYVKDVFGLKVEHPEKLSTIKQKVLEAIAAPGRRKARRLVPDREAI